MPTRSSRHSPIKGTHPARADQTTVRRANLGVVLRYVSEHGPCSRAAVAAGTGLTRGTVSSLVSELVDLGLVRDADVPAGPPRIGRPGVAIEVAGTVGALGLEVNVDYVAACVEDVRGDVRYEERLVGDNRGSAPDPTLDRLACLARAALDAAEADGIRVVGIALAVPGLVRVATGTVLRAPNLGWEVVEAAGGLRERLSTELPIHLENESNLAAIAEHWRGAGQGLESFLLVFGEIGVGGGIFLDGGLFRGAHGYGGELGHVTIDPEGERCACGSRGCLETLVGPEAIARRAGVDLDAAGGARPLTDELVRRAQDGDPATLEELAAAGATLGTALASGVNLLDLEGVVLGGLYGPLAPWLAEPVGAALREHVLSARWSTPEVRASTLAELAAVRGAAAYTIRSVLADPWALARSTDEQRVAVT